MPAAYVILNNDGSVSKTHSTQIGAVVGAPSAGASDLESLIHQNYQPVRETPLEGGKVLIVMLKP